MKELEPLLVPLVAVFLFWLAATVSSFIIKKNIFREIDIRGRLNPFKEDKTGFLAKKKFNEDFWFINSAINIFALVLVVILIVFLYNPVEKGGGEIPPVEAVIGEDNFSRDLIKKEIKNGEKETPK